MEFMDDLFLESLKIFFGRDFSASAHAFLPLSLGLLRFVSKMSQKEGAVNILGCFCVSKGKMSPLTAKAKCPLWTGTG
jgi:hypothetical protein